MGIGYAAQNRNGAIQCKKKYSFEIQGSRKAGGGRKGRLRQKEEGNNISAWTRLYHVTSMFVILLPFARNPSRHKFAGFQFSSQRIRRVLEYFLTAMDGIRASLDYLESLPTFETAIPNTRLAIETLFA